MKINAPGITPEVVAVIAASVYAMMGTRNIAIKIKRTSDIWPTTGRQKLMDVRQLS